jgi:hypothetical protein
MTRFAKKFFPKFALSLLIVAGSILPTAFVIQDVSLASAGEIPCTVEARLCPDGSSVGRIPPSCDFAPCPAEADKAATVLHPPGKISGKVRVGPLCPIEPCPVSMPNPYSSRQIVLEPVDDGTGIAVPALHMRIKPDGRFEGEAPAGVYRLTITDCQFLGCRHSLPKTVIIEADKVAEIDIDIDTGIR